MKIQSISENKVVKSERQENIFLLFICVFFFFDILSSILIPLIFCLYFSSIFYSKFGSFILLRPQRADSLIVYSTTNFFFKRIRCTVQKFFPENSITSAKSNQFENIFQDPKYNKRSCIFIDSQAAVENFASTSKTEKYVNHSMANRTSLHRDSLDFFHFLSTRGT